MHARATLDDAPVAKAAGQPSVWLVLGDKRGDNAQVHVIERALGWPCEHKFVQMREPYVLGKPKVEPSLHHIDPERSDPLEPPWPDLVITIGRRPSMVALWIREQSGGRTRLVLLGKPSGMMDRFDLVVASSEAQLPPLANVLPITLPLMRVDEGAIAAAARAWAPRFADLPRPLIAFLIGGPTGPFRFDEDVEARLLGEVRRVVDRGGTPYLTTSRRTPPGLVTALAERLPPEARLFAWQAEASDNPYHALLGHGDGFVVTGDSISMMVEIARLGKPLAILPLPTSRIGALDQLRRSATRLLFAPGAAGPRQSLARAVFRSGLLSYTRDFRAFHRMLVERGLAVWAGEPFCPPRAPAPDDLAVVVERIRALLERH